MFVQEHDENYYRIQKAFDQVRTEQGDIIRREREGIEKAISALPSVKILSGLT